MGMSCGKARRLIAYFGRNLGVILIERTIGGAREAALVRRGARSPSWQGTRCFGRRWRRLWPRPARDISTKGPPCSMKRRCAHGAEETSTVSDCTAHAGVRMNRIVVAERPDELVSFTAASRVEFVRFSRGIPLNMAGAMGRGQITGDIDERPGGVGVCGLHARQGANGFVKKRVARLASGWRRGIRRWCRARGEGMRRRWTRCEARRPRACNGGRGRGSRAFQSRAAAADGHDRCQGATARGCPPSTGGSQRDPSNSDAPSPCGTQSLRRISAISSTNALEPT